MPKMTCSCGNVLNLQKIPSEIQYNFISDVDYDKYHGIIDSEDLYQEMKMFFRCFDCGRLWVFWNGFEEKQMEYVPIMD